MRLRVALSGIKPAPWRRIEVTTATTLVGLHEVIQVAMGWEDLHLHCFRILGRRYDGEYADLTRVLLADLRLRAGERFTYTYNHFAGWEHELRVEAVGPGQPRCRYPRCIGGQHPCPPEWCSAPEALDEIKGELLGLSYAVDLDLMLAFGRAVLDARDGTVREVLDAVGEDELRLALTRQRRREALLAGFDRRRANGALAQLGIPTAETVP
ncbi:MAG: plasmid pRiA4b ORF-3 family protein [Janthinobacterium lividum]